jgi:hypothetical protein
VRPEIRLRRRHFVLSALLVGITACEPIPILAPVVSVDKAAFADPQRAVTEYFALLNQADYAQAQSMLTADFQQRLGPSGVQALLHAFRAVRVTDVLDAVGWANEMGGALPAPPADRREYLVTLQVQPATGDSDGWSPGTDRRFIDLVNQLGSWRIDAIGTSPGVLITGKPPVALTNAPETVVLPNSPLRLGPEPVDRVIYTLRQKAADRGQLSWATDPRQVVHRDGPSFGLDATDPATLVQQDNDPVTLLPRAQVRVLQQMQRYLVTLEQPIKTGPGGVWAITNLAVDSTPG